MTRRVLGHALPARVDALITRGEWDSLRDSPGFRAICSRYRAAPDAMFYELRVMESETRALGKILHPGLGPFLLGLPDDDLHPGDIDPGRCVLFADLGTGTDQPLALDYRCDPPRVLLLVLGAQPAGVENRWRCIAQDFDEFYEQLVCGRPA